MKQLLVITAGLMILVSPGVVIAGPGHGHEHHKQETKMALPSSVTHDHSIEELLTMIRQRTDEISAAVSSNELAKLHTLTEELIHAAAHVPEKAQGANAARIKGAAANIISLANELHKQGDGADHDRASATVKKLQGSVSLLEAQYK